MAVKAPVKVKAKARPKTSSSSSVSDLMGDPWSTPPISTEERLNCIEALGKRILEHVRYMCAVEKMVGTSREAKDQAVQLFYERLRSFEVELNRVQESLRLG